MVPIRAAGSDLSLSGADTSIVIVVLAIALVALVFGFMFRKQVLDTPTGTESMREIGAAVQEGASAYLARMFRTLAIFAVVAFLLLLVLPADDMFIRIGRSVAFFFGAGFSAFIGWLGMNLATAANMRVAEAARHGDRDQGIRIAFRTGGTVGMATVGLGLFGAALVVLVFQGDAPTVLEGFGFGAALLAMFMRVGGGIFTKAADVGADLVGKIEAGIPEDDPRNAATIADNVGDNVGDCAGMAADLFESYAVTLVAALILGTAALGANGGLTFPLIIPAIGVLTAIMGVYITKARPGQNALQSINQSFYISAAVAAVASVVAAFVFLPTDSAELAGGGELSGTVTGGALALLGDTADLDFNPALGSAAAVVIGIVLAAFILWLTGYFTGTESKPTNDVARTSLTGPATVILSGIGIGLESAVYTAVTIAAAIFGLFLLADGSLIVALFYVALAGCGLLTTVGVIVAMDTFGPVSDNAQGIAEMSGDVDDEGAQILTELDAVGNTTKAITKGIAITTAVLAATALFGAYWQSISDTMGEVASDEAAADVLLSFLVIDPRVLAGVLIGGAAVFLFSGLAINAVTRAAGAIVFEVRRQFREKPGIMDYSEKPDYARVVDICTRDSLRELTTPGLLAVFAPIAVGFGLGVGALAGYLAGAIGTGVLMAVFLANSGGAWDNAKKIVEDGRYGGKGTDAHAATVIGDTVGDPFKDTAGPSINPLIKVMNLVALLIAPAIVGLTYGDGSNDLIRYGIALVSALVIVAAVVVSKRRDIAIGEAPDEANILTEQR